MAYVTKHEGDGTSWNLCGLCHYPTRDSGRTEECQNPACPESRGDYESYARLWEYADNAYAEKQARKTERRLRSWSFRSSRSIFIASKDELATLV